MCQGYIYIADNVVNLNGKENRIETKTERKKSWNDEAASEVGTPSCGCHVPQLKEFETFEIVWDMQEAPVSTQT